MTDSPFNSAVLVCRKNITRLKERAVLLHEQLIVVNRMLDTLEDEFEYLTNYLLEESDTSQTDTAFYIPKEENPFR